MSNVKSINELTSFHKTIKAEPFEDVLYGEACKNLKGNFGEHSLDQAIMKLPETSSVVFITHCLLWGRNCWLMFLNPKFIFYDKKIWLKENYILPSNHNRNQKFIHQYCYNKCTNGWKKSKIPLGSNICSPLILGWQAERCSCSLNFMPCMNLV